MDERSLALAVVIPVALAVLKTLLRDEISYWISMLKCFFHRPFDLDNRPDTHDWCLVYNPGDGTWEHCSLKFHFSAFKGKNGVFVHRYDDVWKLKSVERVSFGDWMSSKKARLDRHNIPSGLYGKIHKSKAINNY